MKISCIALNSNLMQCEEQTSIIEFLSKKLYEIGENFSLISYFDNNYNKLKDIFDEYYDFIFIIGTEKSIYNHNIKENLSKIINEKLSINQNCYNALKKYCDNHNIVFSIQEEMECMLPNNSIPLFSESFYNNGFMYKLNQTYLVFVPENFEFVKQNYFNFVLPIIKDLIGINYEYQVIKCFGVLEKDIRAIISQYFSINDIKINIVGDDLDNTIYIRYSNNIDKKELQECIAGIISKLKKFIYALEDISIYQMAIDLLMLQKKHLCLAETVTYGNITKELSLINSDVINSSFLFVDFDKIQNSLQIDDNIIKSYGKFSVNTVYEFSNALLEKNNCYIVLFVLGDLANSDICYMSIGDIDGIHVYKNKINISNENLIQNLSKTAIFYLIKKLKQNDLQFT